MVLFNSDLPAIGHYYVLQFLLKVLSKTIIQNINIDLNAGIVTDVIEIITAYCAPFTIHNCYLGMKIRRQVFIDLYVVP